MLYTADFETTTKAAGDDSGARIWAWAVCSIDDPNDFTIDTDMKSFLGWIGEHPGTYYFHNLRFDGRYIVDYLYKNGWTFVTGKPRRTRTFTCMVSRLGQWYSITMQVWNKKAKTTSRVTIQDSLKLLPFSVAQIAKAFDLDEGKGDLDYETYRPEGHELTDAEKDYIRRDVQIMAKALKIAVVDEGMTRGTIGSNALASWKKGFGKRWRLLFPRLGNVCDSQIRQAYRGGFTYCMPEFRDKDIGPGISVDFNSMYPSMMIAKDFPYGEPVHFEGQYETDYFRPLYVQHVLITWSLKPNGIPFMKPSVNGIFDDHEYPEVMDEPVDMWISSVDLELMDLMYDYDIWKYIDGYKFCAKPGTEIFGEYIHYWGERKKKETGPKRLIAKLYLNNLYGKFATRPDPISKFPVMLENEDFVRMVDSDRFPVQNENGEYELVDASRKAPEPVYVPVAVFCTAYARDTLLRAAMKNRDRFVYCDTDSMHLLGTDEPAGIPLHDSNLGAWKVEGTFTRARHLRAKTYMWDLNGETSVTCAGMPDNIKEHVTWENFHEGFTNVDENGNVREGWGKLLSRTVDGGVLLYEGKFEIKGDLI